MSKETKDFIAKTTDLHANACQLLTTAYNLSFHKGAPAHLYAEIVALFKEYDKKMLAAISIEPKARLEVVARICADVSVRANGVLQASFKENPKTCTAWSHLNNVWDGYKQALAAFSIPDLANKPCCVMKVHGTILSKNAAFHAGQVYFAARVFLQNIKAVGVHVVLISGYPLKRSLETHMRGSPSIPLSNVMEHVDELHCAPRSCWFDEQGIPVAANERNKRIISYKRRVRADLRARGFNIVYCIGNNCEDMDSEDKDAVNAVLRF